jgi:hypothetical protein
VQDCWGCWLFLSRYFYSLCGRSVGCIRLGLQQLRAVFQLRHHPGRTQRAERFLGIACSKVGREKSMFSLLFDSGHRVLLAQFAGVLSSEDIEGLHNALVAFVAHHGFARGILDFSSVHANALPRSFLVWRARLPLILLDQERVIVAPQQELHELARAYVAQQRDFGNLEGQIVRTLDDAYLALDLKQPDFRPVLTATDYLSR